MAVVFCLLVNRVHFYRDKTLTTHSISRSRAELCEILATRVLREYGNNMMDLALALTTSWPVYNGADERMMELAREEREDLDERVGNAIEMAILGKSKRFIKSSVCQRVIDSIWSGKCVYQAESNHSILSDTYKRNPIHFYDPHKAPLLDHYRLKVPFIRSVLEYMNFLILFILFVFAVEQSKVDRLNVPEVLFMVYAAGFTLEKVAAMQEHGIAVYFKGTWNGFDLAFVTTYCIYAFLRLYGVNRHNEWARSTGIDILALIACLMFPRLAFVTLKNNLMVLSLRAMMVQFIALMFIAAFCFCGFLYALWTLSRNEAQYTAGTIAWWMLDLWFGLDASGFDKATEFHPLMGPVLMVTYACLSNTLLLTVLVSILSNTFATINEDAAAEAMFRRAVSTIEGVKADSLFSYQPPVNLIAVCTMLPLSYILSPRWFHKVNVFMIRLTSFPILLFVALYERQAKINGTIGFYDTASAIGEQFIDTLPRSFKKLSLLEGLAGSNSDIDAIFEIEDELNTSALDTRDDIEMAPSKPTQIPQQPTSNSLPKASPSFPGENVPSPSQIHDQTGRVHFEAQAGSSPSHHIAPRARVNSVMKKGTEFSQSFTSPLAQIYQPLVVDNVPLDDETGSQPFPVSSSPGNGPPPPLISYGPASRRRLSSTIHRRTTSDVHRALSTNAGVRRSQSQRRPSPTSALGATQSPSVEQGVNKSPDMAVLSESPPPMSSSHEQSSLPTVGQVLEENDTDSAQSPWNIRFDEIESRQRRIESLLETIVDSLGTKRQ
ncbi:hypothetical protein E1B28_007345 [Marasmius oreades]|uniref:Calcium channel YVC1 n=1 Tax=Marasmius oreades TaxID=181124 RepID=A0A9P7S1M7_9AGAR|nr:uncharacterized protein E1B28_007345 [Marasmius oreades]KAG7093687.1 hypothetical protein E1B28_007345 [Marasmius oreades]